MSRKNEKESGAKFCLCHGAGADAVEDGEDLVHLLGIEYAFYASGAEIGEW